MASIKLFKRVFKGTGNILGEFPSTALENVEKTFTRDDIADEMRENQNGPGGEPPKTPPPPGQDVKDIDPPAGGEDDLDQNDINKPNSPFIGNNGNNDDNDGQPDKNWDRKGDDIDTEYQQDPDNKPPEQPGGGGSSGGSSIPGEEQEYGPGGQSEQDGQEGEPGEPGQGEQEGQGNQGGQPGQDGQGGGQLGQEGPQDQNGNSNNNGQGGNSGDEGQEGQPGNSGNSGQEGQDGQPNQPGQPGEPGEPGEPGQPGQDGEQNNNNNGNDVNNPPFRWDDEEPTNPSSPGQGDNGEGRVSGRSIMEEALRRLNDGKSAIQKAKDNFEDEMHGEGETARENRERRENPTDRRARDEEYNKAKNAVTDAIKKAQANKDSSKESDDGVFSENDMLGNVGTGNITSLYKPVVKKKWQKLFTDLLEKALGYSIQFNPNLINKRIEDAPPGRESERSEIKNIMILLDCSGSMGSQAFIKVINHLDAMMKSYDLSSANFVVTGFGSYDINEVISMTKKCKGKKLKTTVMSGYSAGGGTDLAPALKYAVTKHKNMDAYLIFTDGGISDPSTCASDMICKKFFKTNKDRIIWVLTTKKRLDIVKSIDSYSIRKKQYVVFQ